MVPPLLLPPKLVDTLCSDVDPFCRAGSLLVPPPAAAAQQPPLAPPLFTCSLLKGVTTNPKLQQQA